MDNYKWALEKLKLTLNECMHPRVIVTDRELALMKACEIVFPHANHLLCRWHIGQNIMKNCKQTIRSKYDWNLFQSAWKVLEDSPSWISYEENYKKLQTLLSKYPRKSFTLIIFYTIFNFLYNDYQTNYDRDPIPDLNEDPTRHSLFVDLNEEPANVFDYILETNHFVPPIVYSHRLFVDLNEEPVTNPLLDDIPDIFHRYIKDLNNVKSDGNFEFRSVAVGIGRDENMWPLIRQELLQELRYHEHDYTEILTSRGFKFIWDTMNFSGTGFAPIDKWMSMTDTGLVIASFYRRPVVFISMVKNVVLSSTCFPLWSGPHESESTEPIVVARVGGSHFINLFLREGYPILSTHPQWRTYRIDRASAWEDVYSNRQLAFEEYIRSRR
ncbi:probable terpene synthase 6 [Tanacetum coccineum]|uniref:Probable terpene synthase 6 n=1 Tax=Tanacetum coccineum TaxID=301880 RepID=A0ABQ5ARW5_9ASTR